MSLLPLTFFTGLVAYLALAGRVRAARLARLLALAAVLACLLVWAYGCFTYGEGDGALAPAIDDFYATAYLRELLGAPGAGAAMLLLAAGPLVFAVREMRRR